MNDPILKSVRYAKPLDRTQWGTVLCLSQFHHLDKVTFFLLKKCDCSHLKSMGSWLSNTTPEELLTETGWLRFQTLFNLPDFL